jgi:hypothetical protein
VESLIALMLLHGNLVHEHQNMGQTCSAAFGRLAGQHQIDVHEG